MKRREICQTGKINNSGRLEMNMEEINKFFINWKGATVTARFTVASIRTSEALKGYYYNYIVPTFQQALWNSGDRKTEKQTEFFLRTISPICYNDIPKKIAFEEDIYNIVYDSEVKEISELSNSELTEHIEMIKQIAAENYSCYISDSNI